MHRYVHAPGATGVRNGSVTTPMRPPKPATRMVVSSVSLAPLTTAFHSACSAAAARTMPKMVSDTGKCVQAGKLARALASARRAGQYRLVGRVKGQQVVAGLVGGDEAVGDPDRGQIAVEEFEAIRAHLSVAGAGGARAEGGRGVAVRALEHREQAGLGIVDQGNAAPVAFGRAGGHGLRSLRRRCNGI